MSLRNAPELAFISVDRKSTRLNSSDSQISYAVFCLKKKNVSFSVDAGEIVSIFGRNGAGKTTTLRTIMGWLRPSQGRIVFEGVAIGGMSQDRLFRKGIAFIPEDRRIFATLSVEENLILGLFSRWRSGAEQRLQLDRVFDLFPRLRERRRQLGKTLSGGEQQMLAIGRAL